MNNQTIQEHVARLTEFRVTREVLGWGRLMTDAMAKDKIFLRASALTYTTVLSVVPFLAVAFSVLKGFGFQNTDFIRDMLLRVAAGREQVVDYIITYINQTNVRTLGVMGVGLLFLTVLSMISTIESALNTIWGVEKGRGLARKVTDYLSATLIIPVFSVAAFSISATLQNNAIVQKLLENSVFNVMYMTLLKLTPYAMIWLLLLFIYMMLPNTRVRLKSGVIGALVTALIWQLAQWVYITFQVGATKYNAIYGSFAQLPLFLIWVYMSWVILLLGAEFCFILQNRRNLENEAKYRHVNPAQQVRAGLHALLLIARGFEKGDKPMDIEEMATNANVPVIVLRGIMIRMTETGLLVPVEDDDAEAWTLRRTPSAIRIKDVIDCFMRQKTVDLGLGRNPLTGQAETRLEALEDLVRHSEHNQTLDALLSGEEEKPEE